jgi:MarR family transcriptional regulator, organic hydroperoxide resistance regulator
VSIIVSDGILVYNQTMSVIKAKSGAEADLEREVYNLLFQHFQAEKGSWSAACKEFDLTLPQAQLLRSLTPATPMKMNGLAEALDCDASNITGLVDKLEVRGIIRRQSERGDRRVKMIALTPAGIRLRTKLSERLSQPSASITCLSLTDKRALRRIVKQMVETAAQERMEGLVTAQIRARRAAG